MLPLRTVHPASSKRSPAVMPLRVKCTLAETHSSRSFGPSSLQPFAVSSAGDELAMPAQSLLSRHTCLRYCWISLPRARLRRYHIESPRESVTVGEGTLFVN